MAFCGHCLSKAVNLGVRTVCDEPPQLKNRFQRDGNGFRAASNSPLLRPWSNITNLPGLKIGINAPANDDILNPPGGVAVFRDGPVPIINKLLTKDSFGFLLISRIKTARSNNCFSLITSGNLIIKIRHRM